MDGAQIEDARVVATVIGDEDVGGLVGEVFGTGGSCALTRTLSLTGLEVFRRDVDGVVGLVTGNQRIANVFLASDRVLRTPERQSTITSTVFGTTHLADRGLTSTTTPELAVLRTNAWVHEAGTPPRLRFAETSAFQP